MNNNESLPKKIIISAFLLLNFSLFCMNDHPDISWQNKLTKSNPLTFYTDTDHSFIKKLQQESLPELFEPNNKLPSCPAVFKSVYQPSTPKPTPTLPKMSDKDALLLHCEITYHELPICPSIFKKPKNALYRPSMPPAPTEKDFKISLEALLDNKLSLPSLSENDLLKVNRLLSKMIKKSNENETFEIPELPNEIMEKIILAAIPETITDQTTFVNSIKTLRNIARSQKKYYEILQSEYVKKEIIKRLFNTIPLSEILKVFPRASHCVTRSKKYPTVLEVINNVIYKLKSYITNKGIITLIDAGVNPNFFINENNLLHIAIKNNQCDIVKYLTNNGADVNLKNGNYRGHEKLHESHLIKQHTA